MARFFVLTGTFVLVLLSGCSNDSGDPKVDLTAGEQLYTKNCKVCHAQGINGAPIVGNKKMWGPRAEQGIDVLVQHATEGFGLMPAKGGKTHLTEDDLRTIISYMLSQIE